jgi:nicotinamidase-related amidase
MLLVAPRSTLLLVDFQERLMPAIDDGARIVEVAWQLGRAAALFKVPVILTEQYPEGLGHTIQPLAALEALTVTKRAFNAARAPDLATALSVGRDTVVVAGCEAHVCVLQTVLGLRAVGRNVVVVRDAVGSRRPSSVTAALERLTAAGVGLVTAEMVIFEWLGGRDHPAFHDVLALVR